MRLIWLSRSTIGSRGAGVRPDIDHARGQLAAGQFEDQLAAAAAGPIDPFRIDAALEAVAGIAVQRKGAGRVANASWARTRPPRSAAPSCPAVTSVSAPPMTPPRPTGRLASAMTHMPGCERVGLVVDGQERLARLASRTMISRPARPARS